MSAVADALLEAKEEIFIADWWLTPEIYMKRGHNGAKAYLNYHFNKSYQISLGKHKKLQVSDFETRCPLAVYEPKSLVDCFGHFWSSKLFLE